MKISMQRVLATVLFVLSLNGSAQAQSPIGGGNPPSIQQMILGGDEGLACSALLCLSSGFRPGECVPPLARYFSISLRRWTDTVTARRNFLNLCPASQDTSTNMPAQVEAIVNGAGRCDAAYLNATNTQIVEKKVCPFGAYDADSCQIQTVTVVRNTKPSYCVGYSNGIYSYRVGPWYVGDPMEGGHWTDDPAAGQAQ
ncbi:conjugal transfer protein TrbM [Ralstonia pickettii]|jgi:hypothetical protein|uniref:TrbM/KikA/MpfK family conjugal transfer protein n=1 Tax=Ralstonia pickettii TaxID=329 RepID=UPI001BE433EB|nr:TrbM/KikA/MpfK family conjugal transfer protein [Ralstonia pickettii]MBT2180847.1 conjugal transfer protein TrbM [Ralstonia pickettii]